MWNSVVDPPKTRASCNAVPVIGQLAKILEEYRKSVGSSESRMLFQGGGGLPINLDAYTRRVVLPALKKIGIPWYGWHAFRRGLASNLYALGAQDKIVQRILRHSTTCHEGLLYQSLRSHRALSHAKARSSTRTSGSQLVPAQVRICPDLGVVYNAAALSA